MDRVSNALALVARTVWAWSPICRNRHRAADEEFLSAFVLPCDPDDLTRAARSYLPHVQDSDLPRDEDDLRRLVRYEYQPTGSEKDKPEELWEAVPVDIRNLLIALNGRAIAVDLQRLRDAPYHTKTGRRAFGRAADGFNKVADVFRNGRVNVLSRKERIFVQAYFLFSLYNSTSPDVFAGLLGERAYNVRSVGSRVLTSVQLWYMYNFEYTTFLLIFNWSLERLLGGLVGNTVYGLSALVPAVRKHHNDSKFRTAVLVVSVTWQFGIQFFLPIWEFVDAIRIKSQAKAAWASRQAHSEIKDDDVQLEMQILRQRCDRLVMACNLFKFGRTMDQLVSILKDDAATCVSVYEIYASSMLSTTECRKGKGHAEPRAPKLLLVIVDMILFAFVDFAFYTQPFTFNTVVAYGLVVTIKQFIIYCKRYQTMVSARRLFINMAGQNVWGILLVAVPFRIDPKVFQSSTGYALLLVAVVFAYAFLTEPIVYLVEFLTKPIMPSAHSPDENVSESKELKERTSGTV
ncbi:hypothetical protein K461DRAFT_318127 [Myriangium duriaei CBS 260.36]|uniref:Uncharacterized protein n=1 Tax=Myriangium duriaei CBS 260.36 TaxID=1168546 RepID=A0A9P4JEI7_9PEZI|nr:hypothetical protein K461DRAFT_318127 [Myriangium duriaei CBS 260.36]